MTRLAVVLCLLLTPPLAAGEEEKGKAYRIAIFAPSMLPELLPFQTWRRSTLEATTRLAGVCSPERTIPGRLADTIGGGFCQGLRELGRELEMFTLLYALEEALRQPSRLAAELVRAKADIILAGGTRATLAAKAATRSIPIVFVEVPDPVAAGLVGSLARPGANITGISSVLAEIGAKQLELLKEAAPNVSRIAVLHDPTDAAAALEKIRVAAARLGLNLQSLQVQGPGDFEPAFSAISTAGGNAVLVMPGHSLWGFKRWIVELVRQSNLPAIFWSREFVDLGGLMAYGPNLSDVGRRAANMMDRILKGANPAELPVEQPTKFDLVINMKTAKALGLTIPPSVLVRANHLIE